MAIRRNLDSRLWLLDQFLCRLWLLDGIPVIILGGNNRFLNLLGLNL